MKENFIPDEKFHNCIRSIMNKAHEDCKKLLPEEAKNNQDTIVGLSLFLLTECIISFIYENSFLNQKILSEFKMSSFQTMIFNVANHIFRVTGSIMNEEISKQSQEILNNEKTKH